MGPCLEVGAERRGLACRFRRVAAHGRVILRPGRVVDDARQRNAPVAPREQRRQNARMQRLGVRRRQRTLHRLARQFVSESNDVGFDDQEPRSCTLVEQDGRRVDRGLQQPAIQPIGHDRAEIEHLACAGRESQRPGQGGLADRHGNAVARASQQFRHEERIAAGERMDIVGDRTRASRERGDRRFREGCQRQTANHAWRQVSQHRPQRMPAIDFVVAVGEDDERTHAAQPPADILHQVERRGVGPMNILDDDDGGFRAVLQRAQEGGENHQPVHSRLQEMLHLAGQMGGHVVQRAERLRREQRVAAAPKDACRPPPQLDEAIDGRGLADAGFAENERDAPVAGRRFAQRRIELFETFLAFQQHCGAAPPIGHL